MTDMELFDLRVTVESIAGRSVCGLAVGDWFELVCCPDPEERVIMRIGSAAAAWTHPN